MDASTSRRLCALAVLLPMLLWIAPARGETFGTCTGFITAVPTTITGQGVWCLDRDLSTGLTSGLAIRIETNNVTIECNGFKLGNLAAGTASYSIGVVAFNRRNITIRNCNIRGFDTAIALRTSESDPGLAPGGHLVEDNQIRGAIRYGIDISGNGSRVRRNRLGDLGSRPGASTIAIRLGVGNIDVTDNHIEGVVSLEGEGFTPYAGGIIDSSGGANLIARNRIGGLVAVGAGGYQEGIMVSPGSGRVSIRDNVLLGAAHDNYGIYCYSGTGPRLARDNRAVGLAGPVIGCISVGNDFFP